MAVCSNDKEVWFSLKFQVVATTSTSILDMVARVGGTMHEIIHCYNYTFVEFITSPALYPHPHPLPPD